MDIGDIITASEVRSSTGKGVSKSDGDPRVQEPNSRNTKADRSQPEPRGQLDDAPPPVLADIFNFLRTPASYTVPDTAGDFVEQADDYFTRCADNQITPSMSGLALATGQSSVPQFVRKGQRVEALRGPVSRCITAIGAYIEHGLTNDTVKPAVGQYLLKHLQAYDVEEPVGSGPSMYWSDTQRHEVKVSGVVEHVPGDRLSPQEAYMLVINGGKIPEKTVEELTNHSDQTNVINYFTGDVVNEQ